LGSPTSQTMTRRSTRVRARISILITSLDPASPLSLVCETLIVNAHGCAARVTQPLEIGMPIRLRVSPPPANSAAEGAARTPRETTARIVLCQPIAGSQPSWVVGVEMDKPGNIWGLTPAPEDWKRVDAAAGGSKTGGPPSRPVVELKMAVWPLASPPATSGAQARNGDEGLKKQLAQHQETIAQLENRLSASQGALPGLVREQISKAQQETVAHLRKQLGSMLAESVQEQLPAQTEAMARLQERLAALESLPAAVREQLGETRATLVTATETVRKQLAEAQQETLAQARKQISAALAQAAQQQSPAQAEAIVGLQARMGALESLPAAVREQLGETRAALATAAETVHKQIADAQQETLAQARKQISAALAQTAQQQSPAQAEAIAGLQARLAALESLPGAVREQLGETRAALVSATETVRKQLADAQQETLAQARQQLSAVLTESLQAQSTAQNGVIARLQDRLTAFESIPDVVREQLGEARNAIASLNGVFRKQLAEAQQQTLARAREELLPGLAQAMQEQLTAQSNAIARMQQRLAAFESVPEEVRKQLSEAQQQTLAQARGEMGSALAHSVQEQLAGQAEAVARLQQRLSSLESVPDAVRRQLAEAQQRTQAQVREQLDALLAERLQPLQQELAGLRNRPDDGAQVRAAVAEQFEQLPWQIQQHAEAAFHGLREQARAELERILAQADTRRAENGVQRQADQASAQTLQKELAQARETLEATVQGVQQRIQEPVTAAVADALARARGEISAQLTREMSDLQERGRLVAEELRAAVDLLRNEREATSAQLVTAAAKRDELQHWLAEQQAACTEQVRRQAEQLVEQQASYTDEVRQRLELIAGELTSRSASQLEQQIRMEVENQAEHAQADLKQRMGAMLDRAGNLRQEVAVLVGTLQKESERCQAQARTLLEEKDAVDDWIRERAADFQKMFHDAMVETTGQIRGRLQMAVEMIAEPVEKLRDQAAQQLQEQVARQARQLREDADEAAERLRFLRRDLETAVRESLQAQAAETAAAFGREIAQAAQQSVEEWRSALANNLESIAGALAVKLPRSHKQED